ncbi:MAG TPA: hypothetical protein VGE30_00775 [Candidatus Saccharimonadales bacterium]
MTNPGAYSRPLTEALIAAHSPESVVKKDGQELTLGAVLAFEAAMCTAPAEARSDEADCRFIARLLFDGGTLQEDYVHLIQTETVE